jgi:hypothetical protein
MDERTEYCPECQEEVGTRVCQHCGTQVREPTAAEKSRIGLIPQPNIKHIREQAQAAVVATPGDRLAICLGQ